MFKQAMKPGQLLPSSLSARVVIGCVFFLVIYQFLYGFSSTVISWDTYGYYLYLPQTIIHGDLGIENYEPVAKALESSVDSGTFYQAGRSDIGHWVIKYTMGLAIFYLPFFLIAMGVAWIGGYPMDGFSAPFQHAMTAGSLFYMILGLWLLRKVLLHFFNDKTSSLVLLLIIFGTNYFHMHTRSHCMPHVYLFTAYAAMLWLTIQWYEKRKLIHALGIGLVLGLMTISRVTEFIAIIIPACYGLQSPAHFFRRLKSALKWYKHILPAGIATFLLIFPQLLYWKIFAGTWFYDSYQNAGEGLDFLHPHTLEFLFSYRKGWFLYTPLMLLSIWGIYRGFRDKTVWRWPVFGITVLFIYIASSWTTWWYAASFSQRTMVQLYPVLALALGQSFTSIKTPVVRKGLIGFAVCCVGLNLFQTWQYNEGIIHIDRMSKRYYWMVFGKTKVPAGAEKYLLVNRSMGTTEVLENPEDYDVHYSSDLTVKDGYLQTEANRDDSLLLLPQQFSPKFERTFSQLCTKDHAWLKVTGKLDGDSTDTFDPVFVISTFEHNGVAYKYRYDPLKTLIRWNTAGYFDLEVLYLTPEIRNPANMFQFYFHHSGTEDTLLFRDLHLDILQRKDIYD